MMQAQDAGEHGSQHGVAEQHDGGVAPPTYSPGPAAAAPPQGADSTVNQTPVPVKELPSEADLNTSDSPLQQSAKSIGAPQQSVPGVVPLNQLAGEAPQWIDCPFCQQRTLTRVSKEGTSMQIATGILCALVCICLACVPCLAGWFEETNYVCTRCNRRVATQPESGPLIVYAPQTVVPSKYAPTQAP